MFSEKLNFLISIIGISGGELAHAVSLDPSYISRLRHGKRELPKEQHFVEPMASYFATHIKSDYQKKLICEAMEITVDWPEVTEKAQKYIMRWLLSDNPRQRDIIQGLFSQMEQSFPMDEAVYIENLPDLQEYRNDTRELYFGTSGKQDAFLRFLTIAVDTPKSGEIQMFCNEDLSWQSESPDFKIKFLPLFRSHAKAGNKIKIIHSLSEDTEAMLDIFKGWIPIYLTGYVEPYYYPKIREDFYRRTAFVIPGVAAMISSSLHNNHSDSTTFILTDPRAVKVVEDELNYLLSQSKPLAKVFSAKNKEGLNVLLKNFFNENKDTIFIHENILPFILPENIKKVKEVRDFFHFKSIERLLKNHKCTSIISIPDFDKICSGEIPVQFSAFINEKLEFFTKKEYLENLYYIIDLLSKEQNYTLFIKNHALRNMLLCIKKDTGILLTKHKDPATAFYVDQPNIVSVVWDFLIAANDEVTTKNQAETLQALKDLAQRLEEI